MDCLTQAGLSVVLSVWVGGCVGGGHFVPLFGSSRLQGMTEYGGNASQGMACDKSSGPKLVYSGTRADL